MDARAILGVDIGFYTMGPAQCGSCFLLAIEASAEVDRKAALGKSFWEM